MAARVDDELDAPDKQKPMNHNVKLGLAWTALELASVSVRSGDCLSAFVYLVKGSNSWVGYVQGINGIMQMLTALPAGYLTDIYRRDTMLRVAAGVGATAGAALAAVLVFRLPVWTVFAAMAGLGAYRGLYNPPLESIFADSIVTGQSSSYTYKHIVQNLASCVGPLLSIGLFLIMGDVWTANACVVVVLAGLVMMIPSLLVMLWFDDSRTLGIHSEAVTPAVSYQSLPALAADVERQQQQRGWSTLLEPHILIPVLISSSDMIGSLASGMTLKFFSLFFWQVCKLNPVAVSSISLAAPLCISVAAATCQRLSPRVGRLQINLVTRGIDIVLLCALAALPVTTPAQQRLLVLVHLIRMAFANATRPLLRSILMDYVAKRHRGKINALESVRAMSWSGSAALGGLLIERYGFEKTFLITASIKSLSYFALVPLLPLVPDGICRPQRRQVPVPEAPLPVAPDTVEGQLREPLLEPDPDPLPASTPPASASS